MSKMPKNDPLNEALAAWRASDSAERFTAGARANILERAHRARQEADLPRLAQLFVPVAKVAYAGVLPLLVLALTLGWLGRASVPAGPEQVRIETSKIDGEAVFRIANGGRMHKVYRATSPLKSAEKELLATTDDSFSDSLVGSSGVVYYRID
jgi:hypothetical protein